MDVFVPDPRPDPTLSPRPPLLNPSYLYFYTGSSFLRFLHIYCNNP